jgi:DNA-binding transcriptional ArsR family regulator
MPPAGSARACRRFGQLSNEDKMAVGMKTDLDLRAIASATRLQILEWLRSPTKHFPPQVDGDLIKDGVCGVLIAQKLAVSHPTVSEHLRILSQAGLVHGKRIKQWTFYKRDEKAIRLLKKNILSKF